MVGVDRLAALIELGREERFLEYKQSLPWDDLKNKIAKTAMGMANIRDGGTIIVGVAERGSQFVPEGMLDEHIATYDMDAIQAYLNRFADPYVRAELHHVKFSQEKFIVLVVHEFDEIPVVCKRNWGDVLRQGAIYTRSHRIPETCEVQSQTEMREIIEIAIDKGVRRFVERMQRVGILKVAAGESDLDAFEKQLEGL